MIRLRIVPLRGYTERMLNLSAFIQGLAILVLAGVILAALGVAAADLFA